MLDLLDVVKRVGPKFPLQSMLLDPHDPEWDDDMTYLYVDYPFFKGFTLFCSASAFIFLYNYNIFFHNKNCLLYTSPSPRDVEESRMPSSA